MRTCCTVYTDSSRKMVLAPAVSLAITSLYVISGTSSNIECPLYYTKIPKDVNKGYGGNNIYLCYSSDPSIGKPISEIYISSTSGATPTVPLGFTLINEDLNKGSGGKYIYQSYKRQVNVGDRALIGIDVISTSSPSVNVPSGWNIYKRRIGREVHLRSLSLLKASQTIAYKLNVETA